MRKYYFYKVDLSSCMRYFGDEIVTDLCDRLEHTYINTAFLKIYLPNYPCETVLVSSRILNYDTIPALSYLLGKERGRPSAFSVKLHLMNANGYTMKEVIKFVMTAKQKLVEENSVVYRFGKDSKKIFQSGYNKWDLWRIAARGICNARFNLY